MKIFTLIFCIQLTAIVSKTNSQWIKCGSLDSAVTWINTSVVINNILYLGTNNGVYRSIDEGESWITGNSGLSSKDVWAIEVVDSTNIYAGTNGGGIFLSANGGNNWAESNNGLPSKFITALFYSHNILFAGCGVLTPAICISNDKGKNWKDVTNDISDFSHVSCFAFSGNKYYAGSYTLYTSKDTGNTWTSETLDGWETSVSAIFAEDSVIIAGTQIGSWYSNNYGVSWYGSVKGLEYAPAEYMPINCINKVHSSYLVGSTSYGLLKSDNNCQSWYPFNDGLPQRVSILSLVVLNSYLYGNTGASGIYKRSLSDFITKLNQQTGNFPNSFSLSQNYPNPFNPATIIPFSLPSQSFATLKVYNVLGKEVATLISEQMSVGKHAIEWNAKDMPSGVYFYRLTSNSLTKTNKMILLK